MRRQRRSPARLPAAPHQAARRLIGGLETPTWSGRQRWRCARRPGDCGRAGAQLVLRGGGEPYERSPGYATWSDGAARSRQKVCPLLSRAYTSKVFLSKGAGGARRGPRALARVCSKSTGGGARSRQVCPLPPPFPPPPLSEAEGMRWCKRASSHESEGWTLHVRA